MLKLSISGVSQRPTKRKGNPKGTGGLYGEGMFTDQADLGGGNSLFLYVMCKPAYSARAVWSDRYENDGSNVVLFHDGSEIASLFLHLDRVGRPHE